MVAEAASTAAATTATMVTAAVSTAEMVTQRGSGDHDCDDYSGKSYCIDSVLDDNLLV